MLGQILGHPRVGHAGFITQGREVLGRDHVDRPRVFDGAARGRVAIVCGRHKAGHGARRAFEYTLPGVPLRLSLKNSISPLRRLTVMLYKFVDRPD